MFPNVPLISPVKNPSALIAAYLRLHLSLPLHGVDRLFTVPVTGGAR